MVAAAALLFCLSAMNACFPLLKIKKKSTDPPWFNAAVRRKLEQRKKIYRREGRSASWKRLKKVTEAIIPVSYTHLTLPTILRV